ncbi:MAG: SAM-dependent methyltransferase [Marinilabiliales bacterium]|nr:MAG: SAM-dependent methyltransferase [Marinilabiliales bacterium]
MKNKLHIKSTEDNSHTIYSARFNENYHSMHGAIAESLHVFIKSGLNYCQLKSIKIFEVGFGTGLNAFLTFLESAKKNLKIDYTSIELYPVDDSLIKALNYNTIISKDHTQIFNLFHSTEWNKKAVLSENFSLTKIKYDFNLHQFNDYYDLVYFDAFSPDTQPQMWSMENFTKTYQALNKKGILTTYSSKGLVKNNLRNAGFKVYRIPGPKGKRHILRAIKEI